MKALAIGVIALTLAAVTTPAFADEPAAPEPAASATPLATRPSKPLTLASPSEGGSFGYKLLAGVVVATAAALWLRKKHGRRPVAPATRIDILGRTSLGVRSELLVVEVEGTRLLVGMTPGAIQPLAVLDTPVDADATADEETAPVRADASEREHPALEVADRARLLLGRPRTETKAAQPPPRRTAPVRPAKANIVAGQAKGLLLALEPPPADRDDTSSARMPAGKSARLGER